MEKGINFWKEDVVLEKNQPSSSGAGTGGAGGPLAPPIFGRPINPIPTMGGRFYPPFTSGTPNVFHLPAPLIL
jgi:hypothetical protein